MLKQPQNDALELQERLLKRGEPLSVPSLSAVVLLTVRLAPFRDAVRNTRQRYRDNESPTFWPCHNVWDVLEALALPESGKAGTVLEFFRDVAGLEILISGRRSPSWFKPKPSLVLATVATIWRRQRVIRKLKGFSGRKALTDAELWLGLVVLEASISIRNEILKALQLSSIGDMCGFCYQLILHERKYCSNACMQGSNDLKKRLRKRTRSPK